MMKIIKANLSHADIFACIHSKAWVQAYKDLFPAEYINPESSRKRKEEFIENQQENIHYYLIVEDNVYVGIFKILIVDDTCELSSIYILTEYCHKGYGTACIDYVKEEYSRYEIIVWTLEENRSARNFYEKNHFHDTGNRRMIYRGCEYVQVQYHYGSNR